MCACSVSNRRWIRDALIQSWLKSYSALRHSEYFCWASRRISALSDWPSMRKKMRQLKSVLVLTAKSARDIHHERQRGTHSCPVHRSTCPWALTFFMILLTMVAAAMARAWQYWRSAAARPVVARVTDFSRKRSMTLVLEQSVYVSGCVW